MVQIEKHFSIVKNDEEYSSEIETNKGSKTVLQRESSRQSNRGLFAFFVRLIWVKY